MTDTVSSAGVPALLGARGYRAALEWIARRAEAFVSPLAALVVGMVLFSVFVALVG
ncbi:ABC transporter permease, partial [Mesorhizobium sp. M8A.F.Ca.ET.213.01.1.1]